MFQYMNSQSSSNGTSNHQAIGSLVATEPTNSVTLNSLNNGDDNLDLINPLYEIALQKAPLLYIKRG